jgi:hypothetical protein
VQHFSMQHPALKNVVLPRGIEGNSRRWLARHSDVFELSALDKDGQSTVRIKQGADKIIEARKQQQLAGGKPADAVGRQAVDVLVGLLRKLGGDQVISVLVQYFSMEHPTLKNEVMPRGMAGGPRRWFQEVRMRARAQRATLVSAATCSFLSTPTSLSLPQACCHCVRFRSSLLSLRSFRFVPSAACGYLCRGAARQGRPDPSWTAKPLTEQAWLRLS